MLTIPAINIITESEKIKLKEIIFSFKDFMIT